MRQPSSTLAKTLKTKLVKLGTMLETCDVSYKYIQVSDGVLRGLWRVSDKKVLHLTDCSFSIKHVQRTSIDATVKNYKIDMDVMNTKNDVLSLSLDQHDIENSLATLLGGFASFPYVPIYKYYVIECIMELAKQCEKIQVLASSYGWMKKGKTLTWVLNNGVENEDSFIDTDDATVTGPSIDIDGNGYSGSELEVHNDDVMYTLLHTLLPDGAYITASLLGVAAKIMIPSDGGLLRFVTEIMGKSRIGKTRTINAFLGLFGTSFSYKSGTLLNTDGGGDTKIGRLGLTSNMKYNMFSDFDHKLTPHNSTFVKLHTLRANTNNVYADNSGGGVVGTKYGGIRSRFKPSGALVRTSNYDHAEYSIKNSEEASEVRCYTLVWPKDKQDEWISIDDDISHELETQKEEIYAVGKQYRRWIMHMHNLEKLDVIVQQTYNQAKELVYVYKWKYDLHRSQTLEVLQGMLLWKYFLLDVFPQSKCIAWIDATIPQLVRNRLERMIYITQLSHKYSYEGMIDNFILNTLRQELQNGKAYIRSQQDGMLTPDVTASLEHLGYRRTRNSFECGDLTVGYLVHDKRNVALDTDVLYTFMLKEADRLHIEIPSKEQLWKDAITHNVAIKSKDNKSTYNVKVHGRVSRYLLIPLNILYPDTKGQIDIEILADTNYNVSTDVETLVASF